MQVLCKSYANRGARDRGARDRVAGDRVVTYAVKWGYSGRLCCEVGI